MTMCWHDMWTFFNAPFETIWITTKTYVYYFKWGISPSGHFSDHYLGNLYKATSKFGGRSKQVVSHDQENKHDFVMTVPAIWQIYVF